MVENWICWSITEVNWTPSYLWACKVGMIFPLQTFRQLVRWCSFLAYYGHLGTVNYNILVRHASVHSVLMLLPIPIARCYTRSSTGQWSGKFVLHWPVPGAFTVCWLALPHFFNFSNTSLGSKCVHLLHWSGEYGERAAGWIWSTHGRMFQIFFSLYSKGDGY